MNDLQTSTVQAATDVSTQAQQKAGELADTARQTARDQAQQQKQKAAESLAQVSEALTMAGRHLDQQQSPAGRYVGQAGRTVEKAATYLEQTSVDGLGRDAADLARRRPGVVMGAAFALGFAATRFLKATPQPTPQPTPATGGIGTMGGPNPLPPIPRPFETPPMPGQTPHFNQGGMPGGQVPMTGGFTAGATPIDPAVGATPPPYGVPYEGREAR